MTQIFFIDIILAGLGVFIYFFGLKKLLFNQPRTYQDQQLMAKTTKGMPIEIGIKRLSLLKKKGLITEEIFSDAEELLIKSEMDISSK